MKRLLVLATVLAVASPALGAGADDYPPAWGFAFKLGPYKPTMGDHARYYNAFYASPTDGSTFKNHPLMSELELDWYILHDWGLLGPMLQVGLWSASGSTLYCVHNGKNEACQASEVLTPGVAQKGNDQTKLSVYPLSLGVVYKLDQIKRYTIVPLVPYAKGALSWFLWRNTVGGNLSHYDGKPGEGGTLGLRGTVGLALNLDFIEPGAASRARITTGLTDSYLFGEMSFLWANGFGDTKRLDFSGQTVQVGLAFDFQ